MDAYNILVIVLSLTLAVLLIATIVLIISITKLVKYLQHLTERAEDVMDDVEAVGEFFKKSSAPIALAKLVGNIVSNYSNHKKKG